MKKIERYTVAMDYQAFISDEKTIDAIALNLEIIGEAVWQQPEASKEIQTELPWK